jgi:hypothetical protein
MSREEQMCGENTLAKETWMEKSRDAKENLQPVGMQRHGVAAAQG